MTTTAKPIDAKMRIIVMVRVMRILGTGVVWVWSMALFNFCAFHCQSASRNYDGAIGVDQAESATRKRGRRRPSRTRNEKERSASAKPNAAQKKEVTADHQYIDTCLCALQRACALV